VQAHRGMSLLLAVAALAAMASLLHVPSAFADATPVQLVLLYVPNVSNTGTTSASGIAELVMPEGEVRITAADLPRLEGTGQYVAWAVNTETNEFQRLGAFNTAQSTGAIHYENVLPDAIPNHHWNLLLVTVEDSAAPLRPSNKHSIAGVFPRPDNAPLPGLLPNTGGSEDGVSVDRPRSLPSGANWLASAGLPALTLVVGAGAGYALSLRKR
jgi:hypothetical protein